MLRQPTHKQLPYYYGKLLGDNWEQQLEQVRPRTPHARRAAQRVHRVRWQRAEPLAAAACLRACLPRVMNVHTSPLPLRVTNKTATNTNAAAGLC